MSANVPNVRQQVQLLGEGEKEAVYLANTHGWASSSEHYVRDELGIPTADFIEVGEDAIHWGLLFRPQTNQLIIYTRAKAYIIDAFGGNEDVNITGAAATPDNGGIDLTRDKVDFQVKSDGLDVQFNFDPAMIQQLQNASGLTPVIMNIEPMTTTVPIFLGFEDSASPDLS